MTRLMLALLLVCCVVSPSAAVPRYSLDQDFTPSRTYAAPFRLDTSCVAYQNGGAEGRFTFAASAEKAAVGVTVSLMSINHGYSGGNWATSWPKAFTDDFVISGSGGYVSGTMWVRFRGALSGSGGNIGGGQRLDLMPYVTISNSAYFSGGFRWWNPSALWYAQTWGVLGYGSRSGSSIDTLIAITRTWPVGTPFSVEISLAATPLSSVFVNGDIADLRCDGGGTAGGPVGAGLALGDVTGLVMTLPSGYTLASPSWNIANNRLGAVAGVESGPASQAAFALAGAAPNPARAGRVALAFTLPDGAPAMLELLDVGGRRVASREVGALGAGAHTVDCAPARRLAPGLYFARLTRAGESRSARVVVAD
ncbi:MAG: hypothetical protein HZA61_11975 [Candidatus Eisenbacteria bacterium]|uniref:T9SS type A sorting domain-containing protein n=1 Tax=Eiseniibacteriota bacterium TaxID=2212470 RepID=A0A933W9Q4_UNCEI|nr:hypothetical protein [Candidatus Eisenbacteria bacterium]